MSHMKLFHAMERWDSTASVWLAFAAIAVIGALDYLTESALALSLLCLLPVALLAWKGGRWPGLAGSLAGALAWVLAEVAAGGRSTGLLLSASTSRRLIVPSGPGKLIRDA
jgi:hypothetical protein